MPKVNVEQEVKGDQTSVFAAVKEYMDGRDTLKKIGAGIEWKDAQAAGVITGGNFSGEIKVTEDGAMSLVQITIELPFLLAPFKGKVKEELAKHLSRLKV